MSSQVTLNVWIIIITLSFMIGILQIYGIYRFKSISNLLIVKKRYPQLVMIEAFVSILYCYIVIPLFWFICLMQPMEINVNNSTQQYIYLIIWIITVSGNHFIVIMESSRLWLISFNLNYLYSSKNEKWKSQINSTVTNKNWYLLNKNKYGNRNYVLRISITYYILAIFISSTCSVYIGEERLHFAQSVDGILLIIPLIITIYTYYKCPKYTELNDNFLFHYEFKMITFIFLTGFILYFINQIVHYFGYLILNAITLALTAWYSLILPSLLSTLWIPNKILLTDFSTKKKDIVMLEKECKSKTQRFKMILYDQHKFELFVHWIYREFSSETILCFIEFVQFQQYLINKINKMGTEQMEFRYTFYENIPKSSTVYKTNDTKTEEFEIDIESNRYKNIAHELYLKYIETYCEFQVNISAALRNQYEMLDVAKWDIDIKELLIVLDSVIHVMFKFMETSYSRFQRAM